MNTKVKVTSIIFACAIALVGCGDGKQAEPTPEVTSSPKGSGTPTPISTTAPTTSVSPSASPAASKPPAKGENTGAKDPQAITVLVNKQNALPDNYAPKDLVYPDVRFTFNEKIEKRMMRKEAAGALEAMFAGAKKDGINLAGVSAYRSHQTQTALFNRYVKKDGEAKAKMYSAVPGHSEHETGLAIDVSGSDGKCAAEDCFGDTKEAKWLADQAYKYGFIIRYPKGKEAITGYQYEPWHLRYVGKGLAADIQKNGLTLEEVFNAVPASK
ncbi:D-alanyl-D-alanine carboxypeptidase family protein [Paenibacillus sp. N1-5-1-14]|uniref:D-alanyl-D-alanine carboxypeptidase family protein n=1 Tax=Paenibacillus radicibacter TaxID=2972488 RepID=UPI0021590A0D|nr:D-alanyl-D-alanine carboxypeptidase family protein [Paenibacillus radicibacter]MCR8641125.1 D-alanyl-D-alanine carboxypeptidase family protein [Paenibacillus radicibacter]